MTVRTPFEARHLAVGLDLNGDGLNLPFGSIIGGSSMRYVKQAGIESGPGYVLQSTLGTTERVDDLFGARKRETKSLWAKSGTKIFHSCHRLGIKYDVGVTLTSTERQCFVEGRNGDIFAFNQTDSPLRIAVAALIADCADNSGALSVGTGNIDKFAASGTVYVRGSPVTYSGKSGGTLTGLSGIPAGGVTTGDLVTQTSTPASFAIAKGTCGMIIEGSMLVAGVKGAEDIVYTSAPSTLDNPEFLWDFLDNGASAKVMPNPVVAMVKGQGLGYIFGSNFCESTPGFDVETNVLLTHPVADVGAYNARCVAMMGGRICYLGGGRLMPVDIVSGPDTYPRGKVDEDFDAPILPWLQQFDPDDNQADVALLQFDDARGLLTIAGKINGRTVCRPYDARDKIKAFLPEEIRPMRCHVYFDGDSYFGNNMIDKVYKNHTGLTNDGFPILHSVRTNRMEAKKGRREVLLDFLNFDGFMSVNGEIIVRIYIDGSSKVAFSWTIDDSYITSRSEEAMGLRTPGWNTLGGGDSVPQKIFPFKAEIDLNGLTGEDFMIEWLTSKLAAYFRIKSFLMEGNGVRFTSRPRA